MDAYARNRKAPPAQGYGDDNFSGRRSNSSSTTKSVGPMNLGGSAPPPPPAFIRSNVTPQAAAAFSNSPRVATQEAFSIPSYIPSLSQSVPVQPPTLSIFGNSDGADNAPKRHDIQDYLNGGVPPYPHDGIGVGNTPEATIPIVGYGRQAQQMDGYNTSQVSSPFSVQSSKSSWQPSGRLPNQTSSAAASYHFAEHNDTPYVHGQPNAMGSHQGASQHPGTFSPGGFFGFQGGFAQQMKQFGEMYMNNQEMEEELIDPPLLDELGIDVDDIVRHIKCVLLFKSCENGELQYADFTGPVLILLVLALSLLISCNLNFSLVYAIEVLGTWSMYMLLNLTSQDIYIDMTKTAIILGYSLLPICFTPLIWLFSRFVKPLAIILVYLCVGWSTSTASRLLTQELNMSNRKYMIIYPTLLYYLYFAHVAMTPG